MRFIQMKKEDLVKIAGEYLVELPENANKQQVIAALAEEGVSEDMYNRDHGIAKEPEVVVNPGPPPGVITSEQINSPVVVQEAPVYKDPNRVPDQMAPETLMKMDRANPSYQVYGFKFTQENPFHVMPTHLAEKLMRNHTGFRPAAPWEAQDFYS